MTQTAFKAEPDFTFYEDADQSLVEYLTTLNSNTRLAALASYLINEEVTIRARRERDPINHESPWRFPLVYLSSSLQEVMWVGKTSWKVAVETTILVLDSQPNPEDAAERICQIGGAIASMIKQTLFDESALDWSQHYSNCYEDESAVNSVVVTVPPALDFNEAGSQTGMARLVMRANWFHFESI